MQRQWGGDVQPLEPNKSEILHCVFVDEREHQYFDFDQKDHRWHRIEYLQGELEKVLQKESFWFSEHDHNNHYQSKLPRRRVLENVWTFPEQTFYYDFHWKQRKLNRIPAKAYQVLE